VTTLSKASSALALKLLTAFCLWGDLCVENTGGWIYGRAHDTARENGTPMACCQRFEALPSFGAKTNVTRYNSQNVCSYLLNTYAVVSLYAEDAAPN